jgi:hypothetical protein
LVTACIERLPLCIFAASTGALGSGEPDGVGVTVGVTVGAGVGVLAGVAVAAGVGVLVWTGVLLGAAVLLGFGVLLGTGVPFSGVPSVTANTTGELLFATVQFVSPLVASKPGFSSRLDAVPLTPKNTSSMYMVPAASACVKPEPEKTALS